MGMAKVYLYEDSGGGLYMHRHGDDMVYANVEIMVPYGATFDQDASEIADGREVSGDGVLKIPYSEIEARLLESDLRRIAVWEDGRIHRYGRPGGNGVQYLQSPRDSNPVFDNTE
jgi:hypothetical protein